MALAAQNLRTTFTVLGRRIPEDHLWAEQCGGGATAPGGAMFTEPASRARVALDSAQLAEFAMPAHTTIGTKGIALLSMIDGL